MLGRAGASSVCHYLLTGNLPRVEQVSAAASGGRGGLVKRNWGGEPIASARTDVVNISLENLLNVSLSRLRSIEKKFLFGN